MIDILHSAGIAFLAWAVFYLSRANRRPLLLLERLERLAVDLERDVALHLAARPHNPRVHECPVCGLACDCVKGWAVLDRDRGRALDALYPNECECLHQQGRARRWPGGGQPVSEADARAVYRGQSDAELLTLREALRAEVDEDVVGVWAAARVRLINAVLAERTQPPPRPFPAPPIDWDRKKEEE